MSQQMISGVEHTSRSQVYLPFQQFEQKVDHRAILSLRAEEPNGI